MTEINAVTDLSLDGDVAVITVNSPPVNALSNLVRKGLWDAFQQAYDGPAKSIVLICAGRTFIAGADISEFGKAMTEPLLPQLLEHVEASPKPVIVAIHGTALGGGLETALSANYRVAVPSAKLGLPEVNLGLLPGAGGTQRLPRIVGVEKALDMITSGKPIGAAEAASVGLVDELAPEGQLREAAVAFANKVVAEGRPLRRVRDLDDKLAAVRGKPEVFEAFRKANARKFRGFPAPEAAIQAVQAAVDKPFEEGVAVERQKFMELIFSPESAAQRYYFFAERAASKIPDVPEDTKAREIKTVGIMGAGTMGGGIAMNFLNAGIPVTLVEMKQDALDRGLATIRSNYERTAKRGGMSTDDVEKRMGLITPTLSMDDLATVDLVVEAVFERMDIKKDVFGKLDAICKPGAILASNTSYLDINEIAAATKRPGDVVGLHFFSPANVMRLLEIVRGDATEKDAIATAMKLAKTIGKVAVLVGVAYGFVGNRLLAQRTREAQKLILEGPMPWDVDRVIYDFGLPMGPFAMADLAGLDLGWVKEESASRTVREVLCEMDRRGQKTCAGFYDYDAERKPSPSPVTEKVIKDFMAKTGAVARDVSDQEILERCLYPMVNEGAKILEEGKAIRASDIDVVWVNGYGWPTYRGGPMYWADQVGLDKILARLKEFHATLGDDFKPAPLLEKLVAEGKKFSDLKA
jgi:3-hydroxyacyl-CoA dehydrogenase